jgi:ADP-ribosylglycohydrolase
MTSTPASRVHGCLLGGAIGDALGAEVEFDGLAGIRRVYGAEGITAYRDGQGRITDDTQMTLFTAEGPIRAWHPSRREGHHDVTAMIHRAYLPVAEAEGNGNLDSVSASPQASRTVRPR